MEGKFKSSRSFSLGENLVNNKIIWWTGQTFFSQQISNVDVFSFYFFYVNTNLEWISIVERLSSRILISIKLHNK